MIQSSVSLADKNWFQTGGKAKFYCEPINEAEFQAALKFANEINLNVFVLGSGANVLISDLGFDGLIIHPRLTEIKFEADSEDNILVTAGSGATIADLINACLENKALGLEEFSGIPGTVGGAVFINIHFFKFLLGQFLIRARVISRLNQKTFVVDQNWFNFGYNQSALQSGEFYLIDATFKLRAVSELEAAYAKGRSHEIVRYRSWRYPTTRTCGSFFRNFHEHEVYEIVQGRKMIYVAYYLDKLGLKGTLRSGKAQVSHQHANMIVAEDGATSADIIAVARIMQQSVFEKFGILPQPECLLIGFKDYPLLDPKLSQTQKQLEFAI